MEKTREEILEEIHRLERSKFLNAMNDHWTREDAEFDRTCTQKIMQLQLELAKLGGN